VDDQLGLLQALGEREEAGEVLVGRLDAAQVEQDDRPPGTRLGLALGHARRGGQRDELVGELEPAVLQPGAPVAYCAAASAVPSA
jgi:hypothetical protein